VKLSWGVAALAVVTSGCSFAMNTAPSDPSDRTSEAARECTSSYLKPAMDMLGAGVGGINIGISALADDKVKIYGIEVDKGVGLGLGIGQLALFGAAATYGFIQAGRCNALRHEQNVETDGEAIERAQSPSPAAANPPSGVIKDPTRSPPGDMTQSSDTLPEWSAFRRVPLGPMPPPRELPHRFTPP
jgi:hypothetical protein